MGGNPREESQRDQSPRGKKFHSLYSPRAGIPSNAAELRGVEVNPERENDAKSVSEGDKYGLKKRV